MPPRIRSLKPDCWQDEALGTVSRDARLLFIALITQADDEGRLKGALPLVRSYAFPYDIQLDLSELDGWLNELSVRALVIRYREGGKDYLALPAWERHQRINRPSPSQIPAPNDESIRAFSEASMQTHGEVTEASPPDRKGGDRSGEEETTSSRNGFRSEVYDLCTLLADLIEANGSKRPDPTQKAWLDAARLLLDRDERDVEEAKQLIRWCQDHTFWKGNILSMPTFRKQYDQLRLKAEGEKQEREEEYDWRTDPMLD